MWFQGTLIKYSAQVKGLDKPVTLETWFRPQNNFTVFHNEGPAKRVKVSVNYYF